MKVVSLCKSGGNYESVLIPFECWVGWLVGCMGFHGPLKQYFSLYRAISPREGERREKC